MKLIATRGILPSKSISKLPISSQSTIFGKHMNLFDCDLIKANSYKSIKSTEHSTGQCLPSSYQLSRTRSWKVFEKYLVAMLPRRDWHYGQMMLFLRTHWPLLKAESSMRHNSWVTLDQRGLSCCWSETVWSQSCLFRNQTNFLRSRRCGQSNQNQPEAELYHERYRQGDHSEFSDWDLYHSGWFQNQQTFGQVGWRATRL